MTKVLFNSVDGGVTWVDSGGDWVPPGSTPIGPLRFRGGLFYCYFEDSNNPALDGVYSSNDNGITWVLVGGQRNVDGESLTGVCYTENHMYFAQPIEGSPADLGLYQDDIAGILTLPSGLTVANGVTFIHGSIAGDVALLITNEAGYALWRINGTTVEDVTPVGFDAVNDSFGNFGNSADGVVWLVQWFDASAGTLGRLKLVRSNDGGDTWAVVWEDDFVEGGGIFFDLAFDAANAGVWYTVFNDANGDAWVLTSSDDGVTWVRGDTPLSGMTIRYVVPFGGHCH